MKIFNLIIAIFLLSVTVVYSQNYSIDNGGTITACSGTLFDTGGASGNYSDGEDHVVTICSDNGGAMILNFTTFNTENNYDELSIYDGGSTGSPTLWFEASGTDLQGETVTGTSSCLTLVWHSDFSTNGVGFAADISCGVGCQDYTIDIVDTDPGITDQDSLWIDVCIGETISFTAEGDYPNNNTGYAQSDLTTDWYWTVSTSGPAFETNGVGMTTFDYTFDESGGYFIGLYSYDSNGCIQTYTEQLRIRVSVPPNISVSQDVDTVCPGDPVSLTGVVSTNEWVMSITDTQVVQECITDDQGITQSFCWNVNAFEPGQLITSGSDLESVCMTIEHSWVADVWMYIQCPNGQQAEINYYSTSNPCSGESFGVPDEADDCNPGVGYDYCWTMDAAISHTDWCDSESSDVPAGEYLPTGSYDDLIDCPINGEWCVVIVDDWGGDDGTLFSVSLNFDESILPSDTWTINHTYDNSFWTGDGINPNSGGVAVANPETPGDQTFTYVAIDDFGCNYSSSLTVHVRNQDDTLCCDMPDTYAGPDDHVCTNTYAFTATIAPENTGVWSVINGPGNVAWTNQTSPFANATVEEWGVYEFEWREENCPNCDDRDTVIIEFYPQPTTEFTFDPILCNADHTIITYTGNVDATAAYTWIFDGANIVSGTGQGPYEIYWSDPGPQSIELQVSANGCDSQDTLVNIINPELLEHTLEVYDDPCFESCDGSAELTVTGGTLPYNYSWGSPTNIINNLCAGAYDVTVTDANGCTTGEPFVINEPPELVITNTTTKDLTCYQSNDGEISVFATGGTGDLIYSWSDVGTSTSDRTGLNAGNYCVVVSDANGCSIMECFDITQPDELLVTISPNTAICEGTISAVQASAMGGTPNYQYWWQQGEGNDTIMAGSTLNVTLDTTTVFNVFVEDANGCISNTATTIATVSPEMIIDSLILKDNNCYNSCDGRAEIVMHGGLPPFQYSWGSSNHIYEGLCAGIYAVTVTDLIGCQVSEPFIISEPSEMSDRGSNVYSTSCFGYDDGEINVYVEGGVPPYEYLWPSGYGGPTMTISAGNYTLTVYDDHGCRLPLDFTVEEPGPIVVQPIYDRTICKGQEIDFTTEVSGGTPHTGEAPYDYTWTGTDGSSYYGHLWQDVSPEETTTYTLVVEDANDCVSEPITSLVIVNPDLEIISVFTSNDTICPGDPAIIHVDAEGGNGGPYHMTLQDDIVVPSPFTVHPDTTTLYYITLADMCGTPTVMDSILINVREVPGNLFTVEDVDGCPPFAAYFTETTPDLGQTFLWRFGDEGFSIDKNPIHIYEEPGIYTVSLEVMDDFGCVTTRTIENMIEVYQGPTALFEADPEIVSMLAPEVKFINHSVDATSYYWFFGDGDSSLFVSPVHQFPTIGEYEVLLIAETENYCQDTTTRTITVRNEFAFYMPTSFTPNGDGMNDCFRPCGNGIDKNTFTMVVYDRWGNLVFQTDKFNSDVACDACSDGAWDGTDKGSRAKGDKILKNGMYHWYCEFEDWNGTIFKEQGTVTLIR